MKKGILLIILLLTVEIVSASSIFLRDVIYEGETKIYKTDDGMYVLELLIVSDSTGSAKFRLNNEISDVLKAGENYQFSDGSQIIANSVTPNEASEGLDEVNIYFFGSGKNPFPLVKAESFDVKSVNTKECNFDGQCKNETYENCCFDCGCKLGSICVDNNCIRAEECSDNSDCIDGNACTEEQCVDSKCVYNRILGCELNNTCFSIGYSTIDSYCSNEGWQNKKQKEESCSNNNECITGLCKKNICKKDGILGKIFAIIALILLILAVILINRKGLNIFKRKNKIKFKF